MTDLREHQRRHRKFVIEMGWANSKTPLESVALICEEIGELTHELRVPVINVEAVGNELADIILRTIDLAGELNVDIDLAVEKKIDVNIDRIDEIRAKGRRV